MIDKTRWLHAIPATIIEDEEEQADAVVTDQEASELPEGGSPQPGHSPGRAFLAEATTRAGTATTSRKALRERLRLAIGKSPGQDQGSGSTDTPAGPPAQPGPGLPTPSTQTLALVLPGLAPKPSGSAALQLSSFRPQPVDAVLQSVRVPAYPHAGRWIAEACRLRPCHARLPGNAPATLDLLQPGLSSVPCIQFPDIALDHAGSVDRAVEGLAGRGGGRTGPRGGTGNA